MLADEAAKKAIEAQRVAYNAAHSEASEKLTLNQYTERLLQTQAVKEGAGKADEAGWPLKGKPFNLYEAINTPLPLPATPVTDLAVTEESGKAIVTTTRTITGGGGVLSGFGGLGKNAWLLVWGAVGLGFLLQGRKNVLSA